MNVERMQEIETFLADYITSGRAARLAGVSDAWMRELLVTGRMPSIKTPLGKLIPRDALDAYIRKRSATEVA